MGIFSKTKRDYYSENVGDYYAEGLFNHLVNQNDYHIVSAAKLYYLMFDKHKKYSFPDDPAKRVAGIMLTKEDAILAVTRPEYEFDDFVEMTKREGRCQFVTMSDETFQTLLRIKDEVRDAKKKGITNLYDQNIITMDDELEVMNAAREQKKKRFGIDH